MGTEYMGTCVIGAGPSIGLSYRSQKAAILMADCLCPAMTYPSIDVSAVDGFQSDDSWKKALVSRPLPGKSEEEHWNDEQGKEVNVFKRRRKDVLKDRKAKRDACKKHRK